MRHRRRAARPRHRGGSAPPSASPPCCRWRLSSIYARSARRRRSTRRERAAAAAGTAPHDRAELSAAADQLKARLQREPGHKEGWVLLGRTFASLGRFAEAREAYGQAIALAPNEPRIARRARGSCWCSRRGGAVTPEAEAEFAKSGNDPRARFYGAEAALQRGDTRGGQGRACGRFSPMRRPMRHGARSSRNASPKSPPDEPQTGAAPADAASAGPTAQDVAAAQAMSPEERQAMIRGMVDRLAARLEQNPNDKEGWARLAHAYDVLGEKEKAQAARARAAGTAAAPQPSGDPQLQADHGAAFCLPVIA